MPNSSRIPTEIQEQLRSIAHKVDDDPKSYGDYWMLHCFCHNDRTPSP